MKKDSFNTEIGCMDWLA